MNEILETILRTSLSFLFLIIMANKLGKVVNTKSTYYNFVFYITIGSVAANMGFNIRLSVWPILISFLSFTSIAYLLAYVSANNRYVRKWTSGKPIAIIENGKIVDINMKKLNVTFDMLRFLLREKEIFDINEVEYAVLENNGTLSVLKKEEYRNLTKQDFELLTSNISPFELVINGEISYKNLHSANRNKEWLSQKLNEQKFALKDVQYAVLSSTGLVFIIPYTDNENKR